MRERFVRHAVLGILLICQFTVCFGTETADPNPDQGWLIATKAANTSDPAIVMAGLTG